MRLKVILVLITLCAAVIRLYQLGQAPSGIYVDEASIGYNAWSILHYGVDEHAEKFPITFQAFGEYKLPVYIYGSIPLIALFGLSEFSVRLLSALAGIASVVGIYLLTSSITNREHGSGKLVGLIAAFLFAFSPWSIHFSRGGFEANVALALVIYAAYYFIIFVRSKNPHAAHLVCAVLLFTIALYTYNATRIFLPIFITCIVMIYGAKLFGEKNKILAYISFGTVILFILVALIGSLFGNESARARQVVELENKEYALGPTLGVLQKYFTHFSPEFLFFSGDVIARHSVRELGVLYLIQFPFILIGIYQALVNRRREDYVVMIWLVCAPLSAAVTTPVPHSLRSILMLAPLTIITSQGMYDSYLWIRHNKWSILSSKSIALGSTTLILIFYAYAITSYMHVYFNHYTKKSSWDWDENKTLLAKVLATQYPLAPRVVIESEPQTLIFVKFYNATQNRTTDISKYVFYPKLTESNLISGDIVAINGWKGTPDQLKNVTNITMSNQSIGFKVGEWKDNE